MGAYLRERRKNRTTGTYVELYDTEHELNVFDPDGGRWVTFCDEHATLCNHLELATARSFLAAPWEWCEDCRDDLKRRETSP
jgi:hypothetical protein